MEAPLTQSEDLEPATDSILKEWAETLLPSPSTLEETHFGFGNQFDLQIGDGGAGAFNNCAGKSFSMFLDHTMEPGEINTEGRITERVQQLVRFP